VQNYWAIAEKAQQGYRAAQSRIRAQAFLNGQGADIASVNYG
jgi:hypothetical protein